ncbi:MAG: phosphate acetyltransferase [Elusimicrobia bacterium]|nr:MAG: phosphate acetyltransferase [Elusimicrobiota bacterium]
MAQDIIARLRNAAKKNPRKIVLPEGADKRTLEAAAILKKEGLAEPIVLGSKSVDGITVIDPSKDDRRELYANSYYEKRKHKGIEKADAFKLMEDPIHFGTMMLHHDHVDGFLAGAAHATGDTIRPALQIIKPARDVRTISSFFIMVIPNCQYGDDGVILMGDCAINPAPAPAKLALIAISTARMAKALCGIEPRVAMLSFSTLGSAEHESVDRVRDAVRIAKEKAPELAIDGEMQADAALVPEIGSRKAPDSKVAGKANVLIFPDLQSANIGYKLVQRLANAEAIGPILQGFAKPVNDLSRGATVDDIVNLAAVTGLQADASLR